jgi:hypothetical protein
MLRAAHDRPKTMRGLRAIEIHKRTEQDFFSEKECTQDCKASGQREVKPRS